MIQYSNTMYPYPPPAYGPPPGYIPPSYQGTRSQAYYNNNYNHYNNYNYQNNQQNQPKIEKITSYQPLVLEEALDRSSYPTYNRNFIRSIMESSGFKVLPEEWWHFSLEKETFPKTYFDFDIQ